MSDTASRIEDVLRRKGRAFQLRRRIGTSNTFNDVSVLGLAVGYAPEELVGGITQGDKRAILSNAEIAAAGWPGPPRRGDILVIDGQPYTVQAPDPRWIGAGYVGHVLQVRG
jgi:hypothetical protein